MKILYVCPCWPGLAEAYNEGAEPNGMPGFFYVLKELIFQNNEVDLFLYTPRDVSFDKNMMQNKHWFSKVNIVGVYYIKRYTGVRRILYELLFSYELNDRIDKLLRSNKYNFIYGQGNYADFVRIAANKYNIPFGLRKYGDDFAPLLKQKGMLIASLLSPVAAISYYTKKDFILATNDGTEIDKICTSFKKSPPYKIYIWNNGFNPNINIDNYYEYIANNSYIFQFSRLVRVKGQIDIIDAFYEAKLKGYPGHYIIAGSADDLLYYQELQQIIVDYNISDYVHFLGNITAGQTKYLVQKSLVVIASGVNYNLNNVFIESIGYGGIIAVRDTPLIKTIINNGINGFIFNNSHELAIIINDLYNNKYDFNAIRTKAYNTCVSSFGTWEERAIKEVNLLYQYSH